LAGWTNWRKLADRKYWYDHESDHDGPACYELGFGGPNYGDIRTVYVGARPRKSRIPNSNQEFAAPPPHHLLAADSTIPK
jgi:hypothetical protein